MTQQTVNLIQSSLTGFCLLEMILRRVVPGAGEKAG